MRIRLFSLILVVVFLSGCPAKTPIEIETAVYINDRESEGFCPVVTVIFPNTKTGVTYKAENVANDFSGDILFWKFSPPIFRESQATQELTQIQITCFSSDSSRHFFKGAYKYEFGNTFQLNFSDFTKL